jgi:hypothetical protein
MSFRSPSPGQIFKKCLFTYLYPPMVILDHVLENMSCFCVGVCGIRVYRTLPSVTLSIKPCLEVKFKRTQLYKFDF